MSDPKVIILNVHPELRSLGDASNRYPIIVSCKMFLGCCYQYALRLCICRRNDLPEPDIYEYIPALKGVPGNIIPEIIEILDWEVSIILTQLAAVGIDNPSIESVDRHIVAISDTRMHGRYNIGQSWEE